MFNMGVSNRDSRAKTKYMKTKIAKSFPKLVKRCQPTEIRNYVNPKQDKCWGKPYIGTLF